MGPIGIGETLRQAIAKLLMRAVRDKTKTDCGSLQLFVGLEAGIEGATHTFAQSWRDRNSQEEEGGANKASEE